MQLTQYLHCSGLHAPDDGFAGICEEHLRTLEGALTMRIPQSHLGGKKDRKGRKEREEETGGGREEGQREGGREGGRWDREGV